MLDDAKNIIGKAQRLAAFFFRIALGNRGIGWLGNGAVHGHQPVAGIFHVGSHRVARDHSGVGLGGPILTVANWSGQWPGLVGMLNLNGCLRKFGVPFTTLWSNVYFTDEYLYNVPEVAGSGSTVGDIYL